MNKCPCCGGPLNPETFWDRERRVVSTPLGRIELRGWLQTEIFDLLWRRTPTLTIERILDLAYAHIRAGGSTPQNVYVTVARLRTAVGKIGVRILSDGKGGGGYKLVLPQADAPAVFTAPPVVSSRAPLVPRHPWREPHQKAPGRPSTIATK